MARLRWLFILLILPCPLLSPADTTDLEARAERIESKLMSPCCMSNTLAEHTSPLAFRMKGEIRQMLGEGRSEREILDHYVEEFGGLVLASPPPRGFNLTAYLAPLLFLIVGTVVVIWFVRRSRRRLPDNGPAGAAPPIDPEDAARLHERVLSLD